MRILHAFVDVTEICLLLTSCY